METDCNLYVDSSAALGAVKRKGCGKMRHVRVGLLWIQQKVEDGEIAYIKINGTENVADLMTKHLGEQVIMKHMGNLNIYIAHNKAKGALELAS